MTTATEQPAVSAAKVRANRDNARRSTGPRTAAGKAAASRNAIRHGLFCQEAVLPGEDRAAFKEFQDAMTADLCPRGALEQVMAERIVVLAWKLKRVTASEVEAHRRYENLCGNKLAVAVTFEIALREREGSSAFERLGRYEQRLSSQLHRCIHELRRLQQTRQEEAEASDADDHATFDGPPPPPPAEPEASEMQNEPTAAEATASPAAADACSGTVPRSPSPGARVSPAPGTPGEVFDRGEGSRRQREASGFNDHANRVEPSP